MPADNETTQKLLSAAKGALANLPKSVTDEGTYTVAAACLSKANTIHTGINFFHFTGGPCGESSAIGAAAAAGVRATDLTLMVAVKRVNDNPKEDEMKVLNPCGRCRQQLFDLNDEMDVIIVDEKEREKVVNIKELLPYAYVWKDEIEPERAVE